MRLVRGQNKVVALSFAEQHMFAEQQLARGQRALKVRFANVVYIYPAPLDIFTRLSFRGAEAALHEQFDKRFAAAVEFGFFDFFGGNFADDLVEGLFGNSGKLPTKKNFARAQRFIRVALAMHQVSHGPGQRLMCDSRAGVLGVLLF